MLSRRPTVNSQLSSLIDGYDGNKVFSDFAGVFGAGTYRSA
jgi:hypothetical protein